MGTYLRLTPALRDVLACLLDSPGETWGLQLSATSGRPTGTVYPILERLERERFAASRWETGDLRSGPPRRMYALTDQGRSWAAERLGRAAGGDA